MPRICNVAPCQSLATDGWKMRRYALPALIFAQLLAMTFSAPVRAALGDTEAAAVAAPPAPAGLQAAATNPRSSTRAGFTVREQQSPTGTVIRQFLDPAGVVFAVSWRGPFKPAMAPLLGRYFDTYARAVHRAGSSRSRLVIEEPELVVHAGGHLRSFAGVAYVPRLLPASVSEAQLR